MEEWLRFDYKSAAQWEEIGSPTQTYISMPTSTEIHVNCSMFVVPDCRYYLPTVADPECRTWVKFTDAFIRQQHKRTDGVLLMFWCSKLIFLVAIIYLLLITGLG